MQWVRKDLLHQNQVIAEAMQRCERAQELSAKELVASLLEYENTIAAPDRIVKSAEYINVAAFKKAYEKSSRLLE